MKQAEMFTEPAETRARGTDVTAQAIGRSVGWIKTRVPWSAGDWFAHRGVAHRVASLGAEPGTGLLLLRLRCLTHHASACALAAADCVKATNEPRCKECE